MTSASSRSITAADLVSENFALHGVVNFVPQVSGDILIARAVAA